MMDINARILKAVAGVVSTLVTLSFAFPAMADATSKPECKDCVANVKTAARQLTRENDAQSTQKVTSVLSAIQKRTVIAHVPFAALDIQKATAYHFTSQESSNTFVTIPMHGDYSSLSNFSVELNTFGNIVQYNETLLTKNEKDTFTITDYANGSLNKMEDTNITYMTNDEIKEALMPIGSPLTRRMSIKQCASAVLGIGGALGGLIAAVCSGSCVGAITGVAAPACLACVAMFVSLSAGSGWQFINCLRG
ncbi:Tfp pilus assembly protein PilO [Bifidobacterium commune]|uniref:Uncharacterized protein n=1 Tax=Bifidobacterium commune TaxID=1505727 RepID=A0A1C4H7F6_9BIFI|nr:hypothetical protein [Bifidobacterium commune]MBB2955563.1 Tfp pilus assembly protein PilO [Bifidobacterium commune]SCC80630.1 hypothetical protein GA0061077_1290 [Bifidobacterium commune]